MVTKAKKTAAEKRIEKAKKAYGLAEEKTDGFPKRLIDSPVTVGWIAFAGLVVLAIWVAL